MPWQPSFVLLSALGSVRSAIQHDERLALPLELDRNLLVKGTLERRSGHKREARGSIGSVYRKLGIRSRTELAVGAKDYGLP